MAVMWLPDLADEQWLAGMLAGHATDLGIASTITQVRLDEVRLTHPHRPDSPRCRAWATCEVLVQDGPPVRLYLKGYPTGTSAGAAHEHPAATHLADLDLLVWRFPDDPRLDSLPLLVDGRRTRDVLPTAVRKALELREDDEMSTTVVRYQPERSVTVRVSTRRGGAPAVYAKHLDGDVDAFAAQHEALWANGRDSALRLARPLAVDLEHRVLWTEAVVGGPLTAVVAPDRMPDAVASVGPLLAALHAAPVLVDDRLTTADLLVEVRKKAEKICRAHPAIAGRVTGVVDAAADRHRDAGPERACTLHGDFHVDQLVQGPDGPVLVDLDSFVRGTPEIDLAEFLVDLCLRDLPRPLVHEIGARLLTGYVDAAGAGPDPDLLAVCADAEFVNRCYRHLRRHAPGWEQRLEAELARHSDLTGLLAALSGEPLSRGR
jgi:hypothetical protein